MPTELVTPVMNFGVRKLCIKPYPNHRKGCPNYNKRDICPPKAKHLWDILQVDGAVYVIWTTFDFAGHIEKMFYAHPAWSQRQLECCLYWQGTARKNLREEIALFRLNHNENNWTILQCPEACGVDITATMEKLGKELEWPPRKITYQVALAGIGVHNV